MTLTVNLAREFARDSAHRKLKSYALTEKDQRQLKGYLMIRTEGGEVEVEVPEADEEEPVNP